MYKLRAHVSLDVTLQHRVSPDSSVQGPSRHASHATARATLPCFTSVGLQALTRAPLLLGGTLVQPHLPPHFPLTFPALFRTPAWETPTFSAQREACKRE